MFGRCVLVLVMDSNLPLGRDRFPSVSMLFLGELEPVASGQVPKDADMKYENLVRGLKHVQIKVSRS